MRGGSVGYGERRRRSYVESAHHRRPVGRDSRFCGPSSKDEHESWSEREEAVARINARTGPFVSHGSSEDRAGKLEQSVREAS